MSNYKFIDLIGQVFTHLTVIKRVENSKDGRVQFLCECICGNEVIISSNSLRRGNTKSCGCLQKEKVKEVCSLPEGEAAFRALCLRYKHGAKNRSIEFNLNNEEIRTFTKGNCIYCGIEPQQIHSQKGYNGSYIYNGIDRIDNSKGYTVNNCVSCCWKCNKWKNNMTQKEFLKHIEKISNNMRNK